MIFIQRTFSRFLPLNLTALSGLVLSGIACAQTPRTVKTVTKKVATQNVAQAGGDVYARDFARAQAVAVPANQRPRRFIIADRVQGPNAPDANLLDGSITMLANMGINTGMFDRFGALDGTIPQRANALGVTRGWRAVYQPYNRQTPNPGILAWNEEAMAPQKRSAWTKEIANTVVKPALDNRGVDVSRIALFHVADEPGWYYPNIYNQMAANAGRQQMWTQWLQNKGLQPQDLGRVSWGEVKPIGRSQATSLPLRRLHYWSARYSTEMASLGLRQWTEALKAQFGAQMLTTSNWQNSLSRWYIPSPGVKFANNSDTGPDAGEGLLDWMDSGRQKAVGAFWTEDWFDDRSAELWSMNADVLRAATFEANGQQWPAVPNELGGDVHEFGGYVVGKALSSDWGARLKALALVGHGAKVVQWYTYGPNKVFGDGYSENASAIPAIASANALIGRAEDLLYPGRPVASRVAILLPSSAYVWDESPLAPLYGFEIRGLHHALVNNGYQVDFVDETSLANGDLQNRNYNLIYVTAPNVAAAAQQKLSDWIRDGGTCVLSPGAATSDEYNTPTTIMDAARGATSQIPSRMTQATGGNERHVVAFNGADWGSNYTVPRPLVPLQARDAVVEATSEGQTVLTRHRFGQGLCAAFGFWPGTHYYDQTRAGYGPAVRGVDQNLMKVLLAAPRLTRAPKNASVNVPNIEAARLESPVGIAITLLNWSETQQNNIEVTIPNADNIQSVGSAEQGRLDFTRDGDRIRVTLPLRDADVLMLRR